MKNIVHGKYRKKLQEQMFSHVGWSRRSDMQLTWLTSQLLCFSFSTQPVSIHCCSSQPISIHYCSSQPIGIQYGTVLHPNLYDPTKSISMQYSNVVYNQSVLCIVISQPSSIQYTALLYNQLEFSIHYCAYNVAENSSRKTTHTELPAHCRPPQEVFYRLLQQIRHWEIECDSETNLTLIWKSHY